MRPAFYNLLANKIPEPDFDAPLIKSLDLRRGYGTYTFSRNSSATVFGYAPDAVFGDAQVLLTVDANEQRFEGLRRVSSGVWDDRYADGTRISYDKFKCYLVEGQRTNLFLNSDVGATQSITVTAQAYTLSFWGTGSIEVSGAATGTLNGTGANDRVSLTFAPAAGSVTLTITGSVLKVNFEAGSFASSYIPTTSASVTRNADVLTYPTAGNFSDLDGTSYLRAEAKDWASSPTGITNTLLGGMIYVASSGSNNSLWNSDGTTLGFVTAGGTMNGVRQGAATVWSGSTKKQFKAGTAGSSTAYDGAFGFTVIPVGMNTSSTGQWFGTICDVKIWKNALKDRHLAEITK